MEQSFTSPLNALKMLNKQKASLSHSTTNFNIYIGPVLQENSHGHTGSTSLHYEQPEKKVNNRGCNVFIGSLVSCRQSLRSYSILSIEELRLEGFLRPIQWPIRPASPI
jgi:hypothetical protein